MSARRVLRALGAPVRALMIFLVRVYQRLLSPLVPYRCRFEPSCSEYFIEAVRRHGALRGGLLGIWRILRCQPFGKSGHDPVP